MLETSVVGWHTQGLTAAQAVTLKQPSNCMGLRLDRLKLTLMARFNESTFVERMRYVKVAVVQYRREVNH